MEYRGDEPFFCWKKVEQILGPTISMSNSNKTLYGYASDATSGVESYCFNTSSSPGSYSHVTPHTEQKTYTGSASSSTTYYFHVKDTAGNYKNTSSSITVYLYHCNWCNKDTTIIHYNCSQHYRSKSCLSSSGTCSVSTGICGASPLYTTEYFGSSGTSYGSTYCCGCGNKISNGSPYYFWIARCQNHRTAPTNNAEGFKMCSSCNHAGVMITKTEFGASASFKTCTAPVTCGIQTTTNYTSL